MNDLARSWATGRRPDAETLAALNPNEWQAFLAALPATLPHEECEWFERKFGLSKSDNAEIRVGWLTVAARSGYGPVYDAVESTLIAIGRMKYLRPLYAALAGAGDDAKARGAQIFRAAADRYHPVARALAQRIVG